MLRSIKALIGYPIRGTDDTVGKVKDFLFDDEKWGIRYMVADTGGWLSSKKVLVSPRFLDAPETGGDEKDFPVKLSKEQIEDDPLLEACEPVSRQFEKEYARFHNHGYYWGDKGLWGVGMYPIGTLRQTPSPAEVEDHNVAVAEIEESHVRSASEVIGYHIVATDGEIGHVEDMILDTSMWRIRYLIIDTRNWLPGKKVLVDIDWLRGFDWATNTADIAMAKDQIKDAPAFDPKFPVNRDYEEQLYDFYGRPRYWK
ncbi:MAG: PRC-barrel domain-containing protein [Verrucomicrobiae bacterium]|nr:PRC-barrel domain-containing protein [Verrucomicrobiae bacterium]